MPNSTLAPTWSYHFGHRKFSATATARPDRWRAFQALCLHLPSSGIRPGRRPGPDTYRDESCTSQVKLRVRSDVSIKNNTCRFVSVTWIQAACGSKRHGTGPRGPRGPSGRHARSTGRFLRAVQWTQVLVPFLFSSKTAAACGINPPARHAAPSVRLLLSRLLPSF